MIASLVLALGDSEYSVAAKLFNASIYDRGKQYFNSNSEASSLLIKDINFIDSVLEAAKTLDVNTGKVVRIDINTTGAAKVAFGHIKLALHIFKNPDGGIGAVGLAKDAYNFEYWPNDEYVGINSTNIYSYVRRYGIVALNNIGYQLQRAGVVHPYKYAIQINTVVYPYKG